MKPIHLNAASALALALALGGPTAMAEQGKQQQNGQATQAQQSASAGARGDASDKMMTFDAEELDGAEVVDRNGNDIGEVDALVRGEDGKKYAVISVGGFFDIGDKEIALPLDQLSMNGETVMLPKELNSIDQLQSREEFNEDLYTEIEDDDQVQLRRSAFGAGEGGSGKTMTVAADEIDGAEVVDRNGNDIGEVEEVVRGEDGKTYAVLSVGGFFDIGDKDVALPIDQLSLWRESVVVPAELGSIDQLQKREEYNEDLYTEIEDEDQIQIERSNFAAMETANGSAQRGGTDGGQQQDKIGMETTSKSSD